MAAVLKPQSETELAELITAAASPFEIVGNGSKRGLGRPVSGRKLDLSDFTSLHAYEPEELIFEAGAGMPLAEAEKLLDRRKQQFSFEPPDLSKLLGSRRKGTLGGLLACNLAGPRRIKAGSVRDHVLGVRGVSGRGEIFKAGARVVKNVTGYDLPKLMAGSCGTLAALTAITFKVMPKPETEATLVLEGCSDEAAIAAMSRSLQSACDVSGAAHVPGEGTYLRLEGIAASVGYRAEKLERLLEAPVTVLGARQSSALWKKIRDVEPLVGNKDDLVWRLSVPPSEGAAVMARIRPQVSVRHFYDWGGGLIWLAVPYTDDASSVIVRGAIATGHATLIRAPEDVRRKVAVFHPQLPALAALTARVKQAFDPRHILNPGRMYEGV